LALTQGKVLLIWTSEYSNLFYSQVISGNVIAKLGIKYTFLISCCIVALLAVLIYLFVWETTYQRKTAEVRPKGEITIGAVSAKTEIDSSSRVDVKVEHDIKKGVEITEIENISPISFNQEPEIPEQKLTWKQQRKVFRGRVTQRKLLQAFFQPLPLLLFPSVLFATFVNGAFTTWLQMSGLLKSVEPRDSLYFRYMEVLTSRVDSKCLHILLIT
jgi:hypothetical protein